MLQLIHCIRHNGASEKRGEWVVIGVGVEKCDLDYEGRWNDVGGRWERDPLAKHMSPLRISRWMSDLVSCTEVRYRIISARV